MMTRKAESDTTFALEGNPKFDLNNYQIAMSEDEVSLLLRTFLKLQFFSVE